MSLSARSYGRIINANERIRLAQIGCGGRGLHAHMKGVHQHDKDQNVEYVAVSDPGGLRGNKLPHTARNGTVRT